jgi:sugar lactone lactonase YvrE
VADTYNSKLKVLDPHTRCVSTVIGDGVFEEPGGLSFAGDTLYVADTDHNRIMVVDVKARIVTPLALSDPNKLL